MPAAPKRGTQPRSPERQALAAAIQAHADAVAQLERVQRARAGLDDKYFGELQPAVRRAMDRLNEAKIAAPARFVSTFLGEAEPEDVPTIADAEAALRRAEIEVEHAQKARAMLLEEAGRAARSVSLATPRLDEAVNAVIRAESAALLDRFVECRQRFAEAAAALLSLPEAVVPPGVSGWQTIGDVNIRVTGNRPDPAVAAWLADLREDADAPLPGLPTPEAPEPQKAA